jgi:hypothetical protein
MRPSSLTDGPTSEAAAAVYVASEALFVSSWAVPVIFVVGGDVCIDLRTILIIAGSVSVAGAAIPVTSKTVYIDGEAMLTVHDTAQESEMNALGSYLFHYVVNQT